MIWRRFASAPWALVTAIRAALYARGVFGKKRLDRPTISVGALEMGGTGKTPAVAMLANLLRDAGLRPSILSRGYGRENSQPTLVCAGDGLRVGARHAGDEPAWYALTMPDVLVAVAARREQAARLVAQAGPSDVYLLDDGFQHLRVARCVDLLMVDADSPFYRSAPPPAGRLREGIRAARRADAFLVHGEARGCDAWLQSKYPGTPIFRLRAGANAVVPLANFLGAREMVGTAIPLPQSVVAFAGIAKPHRFWRSVSKAGIQVEATRGFRDHHWYAASELQKLAQTARACAAGALLTTEKDAVRLVGVSLPTLPIYVWQHRLLAADPGQLRTWLLDRVASSQST